MREGKRRWRVGFNFSLLVGVVREDKGKTENPHQHRNASFLLTAFVDTEEEMVEMRNMCLAFQKSGLQTSRQVCAHAACPRC